MKLKVLHRQESDLQGVSGQAQRVFRNPDPYIHPFERAREYTRALVATKLERIFAKPFVKALDAHTDAISSMRRANTRPTVLFSASGDGEIIQWDLGISKLEKRIAAHQGFVRDLCLTSNDKHLFSCGDDKTIKLWRPDTAMETPTQTWHSPSMIHAVDHHWTKPMFVSCGETVDVWDHNRSTPVNSFEWGCEMVYTVRFNPAEPALIASAAADRSVALYDLRGGSAIRKVIMSMRANAIAWNPMEPLNFTVASEDCNLYTFDLRKFQQAVCTHKDHVLPVLDVAFSPTGQEFVSASYDKTIRLFAYNGMRSREVYHTKRMQRVLATEFSLDGRFVFSGSEDTNVRVWKAKAAEKLGTMSTREREASAYREKLKEKFKYLPEVRRIARHRHVPKMVLGIKKKREVMRQSKKRKEQNLVKHSRPGSVEIKAERKRHVVQELE